MEQLYDSNTSVKYPLDPFTETDIPNDMLLDMSFSLPDTSVILLTNFVVTDKYLFISFEKDDGTPIGHLMLTKIIPGIVYPVSMSVEGDGWVVFGPGVRRHSLSQQGCGVLLNPSVVVNYVSPESGLTLFINNQEISSFPAYIELAGGGYLSIIYDTFDGRPALRFRRNDVSTTLDERRSLFEDIQSREGTIYTIKGATPDNGNIDIELQTTGLTGSILPILNSGNTPIGSVFLVNDENECENQFPEQAIQCRQELGIVTPLPLDFINCPEDIVCETEEEE